MPCSPAYRTFVTVPLWEVAGCVGNLRLKKLGEIRGNGRCPIDELLRTDGKSGAEQWGFQCWRLAVRPFRRGHSESLPSLGRQSLLKCRKANRRNCCPSRFSKSSA